MEPIISISFIDKKRDLKYNNKDLIQLIEKTKIVIRPPDYQSLEDTIYKKFKPKENKNLIISILGIFPSGERIEVVDDDTYSKDISNFIISREKKPIFPILKSRTYFTESNIELPKSLESNYIIPNVEDFKKRYSFKVKDEQKKLFDDMMSDLDESLDKSLNKNVQDIILGTSRNSINKIDNLKKVLFNIRSDINKKSDKYKTYIRTCSSKLNDIKNIIEFNISKIGNNPEILFNFEPNKINVNVVKEINDINPIKIRIAHIKIKNLTKNKFLNDMSWLKEEKSDKEINFDQSEISNEYPFDKDKIYKSGQSINTFDLNLIIEKPNEMKEYKSQYKMITSIINIYNKQKISYSLEIVVTMINREEINDILKDIKLRCRYLDLFVKEEDILEIIKNYKGYKDKIKSKICEIYDTNLKENNELLDFLEKEAE